MFTVWALTIQTTQVSDNHYQQILEYSAWLCFMISGLSGLSRMELLPSVFHYFDHQNDDKETLRDLKKTINLQTVDKDTGRPISKESIEKWIVTKESRIEKRQKYIDDANKKTSRRYSLHKWFFVAGIIFVMLSRGYHQFLQVITS